MWGVAATKKKHAGGKGAKNEEAAQLRERMREMKAEFEQRMKEMQEQYEQTQGNQHSKISEREAVHSANTVEHAAMRVQLDLDIPIGFGVLTCGTMELALARAGGEAGNKGSDAAMAALAMSNLKPKLLGQGSN